MNVLFNDYCISQVNEWRVIKLNLYERRYCIEHFFFFAYVFGGVLTWPS